MGRGASQVLDLLADCGSAGASKGVKLGYATLLLNYAVRLTDSAAGQADEEAQLQTLSGAVELAGNAQQEADQEALYRALLAIGTLVRSLLSQPGQRSLARFFSCPLPPGAACCWMHRRVLLANSWSIGHPKI